MISYKEKRKQFSKEAQERISAQADEIRNELRILRSVREVTRISQEELKIELEGTGKEMRQLLGTDQPAATKKPKITQKNIS